MESTKLESVMLKLNPNKSIMLEFMPTDTTVMLFQRYTTPSLEFTLSASAKLILTLIPNGYTTMLTPHMLDTLDTTPSVDTPLLITTATSGTELNTCGNYGLKRTNCLPEK